MASSAQIAVPTGAAPVQLAASAAAGSDRIPGNTLAISNTGTVIAYIGGEDVSTANGFPLPVGAVLVIDVAEHLYAVVSGAEAGAVAVLRVK